MLLARFGLAAKKIAIPRCGLDNYRIVRGPKPESNAKIPPRIRSGIAAGPCRDSGHAAAAPPSSVMNSRRSHSITSSARASRVGGTARPSILAVWALMTSSNLLACSTGRAAGLAPLRMRPV